MSDTTGRPDWAIMKPVHFGARAEEVQDALFLVDEPDVCGTDTLDGYGFGAVLWADRPRSSPAGTDPLVD